jgi:hypothetical protein
MQVAETLPQRAAWRASPFAALALAVLIMLASLGILDLTGGPVSDTTGIVKEVSTGPNEAATVQLANGMLVHASLGSGFRPRAGDEVEIVIRERISGKEGWSFEATVNADGAKRKAAYDASFTEGGKVVARQRLSLDLNG